MQLALKQPADGGTAASAALIDVAKPKAGLPINTTLQRMAEVAKNQPVEGHARVHGPRVRPGPDLI